MGNCLRPQKDEKNGAFPQTEQTWSKLEEEAKSSDGKYFDYTNKMGLFQVLVLIEKGYSSKKENTCFT